MAGLWAASNHAANAMVELRRHYTPPPHFLVTVL
jgi:hypothetical protein